MKMYEAMLDAARLLGFVHEGVATGGTVSTLKDSSLQDPAETFAGGTLWLLSGDNAGVTLDVLQHGSGGTLTFETQAKAVVAGVVYAVSVHKAPRWLLMQAVNAVLTEKEVALYNDNLTVVSGQEEYTLPAGVSNVKRVEVATNTAAPYAYKRNMYWDEQNGSLIFDKNHLPSGAGLKIRIWYIAVHPFLTLTGEINPAVDLKWLRYSTVVYWWRNVLEKVGKDEPMATDLINEAKQLVAQYNNRPLMSRDVHYGRW
jgi:hypothetical protein